MTSPSMFLILFLIVDSLEQFPEAEVVFLWSQKGREKLVTSVVEYLTNCL